MRRAIDACSAAARARYTPRLMQRASSACAMMLMMLCGYAMRGAARDDAREIRLLIDGA